MSIFNKDHYPTPQSIIEYMTATMDLQGKTVLEPSAGAGNIVDFCAGSGATVLACETSEPLRAILETKCRVIAEDFLRVTSPDVSHIHYIIANPPFSADEKHILHMWDIAPGGCEIVSLCNWETYENTRYSMKRKELRNIIDNYGSCENLGSVFSDAERTTDAEIGMVRLFKPKQAGSDDEFEGFFMEEETEEQFNGLMSYNFVRDVVNRYTGALKIFDKQLELAQQMNEMTSSFFSSNIALSMTRDKAVITREEYRKDLQKSAWKFIFNKMNMEKYNTVKLQEQINLFVERQTKVPFTMRNIHKMLEIIIGTHKNRMDAALLDVFERLTSHHKDNRWNLEGWATNSHYLVNEKFIMPYVFYNSYSWDNTTLKVQYGVKSYDLLDDFVKALCYITGEDYDKLPDLRRALGLRFWIYDKETGKPLIAKWEYGTTVTYDIVGFQSKDDRGIQAYLDAGHTLRPKPDFGEWFDFGFFTIKGFKKGTGHFRFKNKDVWAMFNQHVARLKGFPLPEAVKKKSA